jgi:hypothetical protein
LDFKPHLLMPRYLFEPAAEASKAMTLEVVKKLAGEFKTSLTATSIRYVDLGPHPTMIVCHSQLKRRWFHSGPLLPADLYPLAELHHESAAFEILFGSQRTIAPKTISADKWFSRRGAIRYELVEHSMRTNENEVQTLLWIKDDSFLHS